MLTPFTISKSEYDYMRDSDGGYCLACRDEAYGVEPDARQAECESCGKRKVYGIEELLMMDLIYFIE